jgi:hypothetical protein
MFSRLSMINLALLAVFSCVQAQTNTGIIDCYSCTYTNYYSGSTLTNVDPNCGTSSPSSASILQNFCKVCITTVGATIYGEPTISRSCSPNYNSYVGPYCQGSSCYCNTTTCNNQALNTGSLNCYTCSSVPGITTGCEDPVNTGSTYMKTEGGCNACYKTTTTDNTGTQITRGCVYGKVTENKCLSGTCTSICSSNLCNSATSLTASSLIGLFVLGLANQMLKISA